MNFIKRFKILPRSAQQQLSLAIVMAIFVALPLFVWSVTTQNFNINNKAANNPETPTPTPNYCNGTCGSNYNCQTNYFCYQGYCRNPICPSDSTCGCATASPTPNATTKTIFKTPSPAPTVSPKVVSFATETPTPATESSTAVVSITSTPTFIATPTAVVKSTVSNGLDIKYIAIGVFAVIALIFGLSVLFKSFGGGPDIPKITYAPPIIPQESAPIQSMPEEPVSPQPFSTPPPNEPPQDIPQNPVQS